MFLRLFRSTGAQVIVFIPFLGALLWMHSLLNIPHSQFLFDRVSMPLYKAVVGVLPPGTMQASGFTLLLVIILSFVLSRLNTRFMILNNRSYLPAIMFVMITASYPGLQRLNPVIFAAFFLLFALDRIFKSYHRDRIAYEIFEAAFYISLGSLFYPFLIFFVFIVWVGLTVLRPFRWREWVFSILGLALPLFFMGSYYYLTLGEPLQLFYDFKAVFEAKYSFADYHVLFIIFIGFVIVMMVLGSEFMLKELQGKKIFPRKMFTVLLWLFINIMAVYVAVPQASGELLILASIPASFLLAHYLVFMESELWGNIFISVMLLLIVLIQIFY